MTLGSNYLRAPVFAYLLLTLLLAPSSEAAPAKKKKDKPTYVNATQYFNAEVTIKDGKKNKKHSIACFNKNSGKTKTTSKGTTFTAYSKLAKTTTKPKTLALYKALAKAGKKGCLTPSYASLEPYKGTFGEAEARLLYSRFAFGANAATIQAAVAQGLDKTVEKLTSYVPEPDVEFAVAQLNCDGRLPTNPNRRACDPFNPNDLNMDGVKYGLEYRMWKSPNPFFEKMFMFYHDERLSTSSGALDGCERYAILQYINKVRNVAQTGDYKQYMRDMSSDLLMHLEWLDGGVNTGFSPNENWAREFWELGTVGPTNLLGQAVYSDFDIANAALAFTGNTVQSHRVNNQTICYSAYVPGLHRDGPKTIFQGSPHQAVVYDANDMVEATFRHPRTAEHLAEDLWKEFVNSKPSPAAIQSLAKVITQNNYNLMAVVRQIMKSRAFYDAQSRQSLIKHPVDLVFGFLRATGVPVSFNWIDWMLTDLGQLPIRPQTVFGWNETKLAGESFVLEWRNWVLSLLTQGDDDFADEGYDLRAALLPGVAGGTTSDQIATRVAAQLGITLNAAQLAKLVEYLDYDYGYCQYNPSRCAGRTTGYYLDRDAYDPLDEDYSYKLRGLISILTMLPQYRMK